MIRISCLAFAIASLFICGCDDQSRAVVRELNRQFNRKGDGRVSANDFTVNFFADVGTTLVKIKNRTGINAHDVHGVLYIHDSHDQHRKYEFFRQNWNIGEEECLTLPIPNSNIQTYHLELETQEGSWDSTKACKDR